MQPTSDPRSDAGELSASTDAFAPEEDFAALLEESFARLQKTAEQGQLVRGRVVKVSDDAVFVDLGGKSEGVIDLNELRNEAGEVSVAIGDELEATVVGSTGDEGALKLSRTLARGAHAREALINAWENRLAVEGKVTGRNKGGYEVTVAGIRAFVPLSQIDRNKGGDPDAHLNQTYHFRITEFKGGGRNIVLSRAALQKEEAEQKARQLRESLKEGDVVSGTVRSVRDFGVFVDLGGLDGMVHISELSWSRVKHPSELVREGDNVKVQILKFDREANKLSLSMRQAGTDPWEEVSFNYSIGGIYQGKVLRLEAFGAFVELAPGVEGLLHISNMAWEKRIRHPKDVVNVGDVVTVTVLDIDAGKRRIGLGMKQLSGDPWSDVLEKFPAGKVVEGTIERTAPFGVFVTLEPGITGLVPNVETGVARGGDVAARFPVGHVIQVMIQEVNPVERRISLSVKAIGEKEARVEVDAYQAVKKQEKASLGTLGDLLAKATRK